MGLKHDAATVDKWFLEELNHALLAPHVVLGNFLHVCVYCIEVGLAQVGPIVAFPYDVVKVSFWVSAIQTFSIKH